MHSDGFDAEFFARPNDAAGDFAAIGDESFLEHCDGSVVSGPLSVALRLRKAQLTTDH
jgi:hypothetical protein